MDQQTKLDECYWTTVEVLSETGEVHIAHGPAFECFLTLGLCDCCTCGNCENRKTAIGTWRDLIHEETGGAGAQALTRGRWQQQWFNTKIPSVSLASLHDTMQLLH